METLLLLAGLGCALAAPVVFVATLAVGARLLGCRQRDGLSRARALLHRRLANGEIDVEEYWERESALRAAAPASPPRRRRVLG